MKISTTYSIVEKYLICSHLRKSCKFVKSWLLRLEKPSKVTAEIKFTLSLYRDAEKDSILC